MSNKQNDTFNENLMEVIEEKKQLIELNLKGLEGTNQEIKLQLENLLQETKVVDKFISEIKSYL
jgi:hypothetical protein